MGFLSLIPLPVKLAILAVLTLIIGGLTFGLNHYHNAWVDSEKEVSVLNAERTTLSTYLKTCTDGVTKLEEDAKTKAEQVKKAQAQASILARSNESLAQALLNAKPEGELCSSAVKLYQKYKEGNKK